MVVWCAVLNFMIVGGFQTGAPTTLSAASSSLQLSSSSISELRPLKSSSVCCWLWCFRQSDPCGESSRRRARPPRALLCARGGQPPRRLRHRRLPPLVLHGPRLGANVRALPGGRGAAGRADALRVWVVRGDRDWVRGVAEYPDGDGTRPHPVHRAGAHAQPGHCFLLLSCSPLLLLGAKAFSCAQDRFSRLHRQLVDVMCRLACGRR